MLKPLHPKDTTVLIVEDNREDAAIAARALQTFGIKKSFLAETAEDALAFLARRPVDVALIDYKLPAMNGLQLLERIRQSWPQTVAIIVTGIRDERVAASAIKLGAADYVAKDELLTSGIIRSLQIALRERVASREEERRVVLSSGEDRIQVASEEAEWLLESRSSGSEPHVHQPSGLIAPEYGAEGWADVLDTFSRYLHESFRQFPAPASKEEDALVHTFLERGSSPREVMMVYRATLRSLLTDNVGSRTELPFNPTVCLARILARLVDECQLQLSRPAPLRRWRPGGPR